MGVNIY